MVLAPLPDAGYGRRLQERGIMTGKHFEAIAKALRDAYHLGETSQTDTEITFVSDRPTWERLVKSLADVCAETNPRFNRGKFISACYPEAKNNED